MTEETIRRFFNKECTPEEAEQVAHFLKQHPALLEKYLSQEEWNGIQNEEMPEEFWKNIWAQIQERKKPPVYLQWMKRAAVAAAILFTAAAGYNYFIAEKDPAPLLVQTEQNKQHPIHTTNTSAEIMRLQLPDSSEVLLMPGSFIHYNAPFDNDKRDIQLEGEARFIVKKDKNKPFTVFAGNLATTALGTEFTINTRASGSSSVSVKLYTGKVVIKQTGNIAKTWKEDVYLDPGEQLEFNPLNLTASVSKIREEKSNTTAALAKKKTKSAKKLNNNDELVFTSSPLAKVIAELEKHFHTHIRYDSNEISTMNFTGTISRQDSLPVVLKVIAQMNGLDLIPENDGFILKKQ